MTQKIALFNHKGGVSKTTTTFNLGWMLAAKGKRVILVDTDPQCNLTGMFLGGETEEAQERIELIYNTKSNIKTGLAPAFESQPRVIEGIDCISSESQERLFLLPGHVGLAEYEVTLGIPQELSGSVQALKNLPGSITDLLDKTAKKHDADYILIDMSPSLGSLNQNLLMTSHFFLVPTNADFFSVMAIDSLTKVLPRWHEWAKKASELQILKNANYPFPEIKLRFLGTIIHGREIPAVNKWISRIEKEVAEKLVPVLEQNNLLLPDNSYGSTQAIEKFTLSKIPNFDSLIALSQQHQTPVFDLTVEQLKTAHGYDKVLDKAQEEQTQFKETFSNLADKIINLTSAVHAASH